MTSPVWRFFSRDKDSARCRLCVHDPFPIADGSTSNMMRHLKNKHNISQPLEAFPAAGAIALQAYPRPTKLTVIRYLLLWLVSDMRPLSLPDSPAFKDFMKIFGAPEIPHSTNLTRTYLPRLYRAVKKHLCSLVAASARAASFAVDIWKDPHVGRSYLTISLTVVHKAALTTICLKSLRLQKRHSGLTISEATTAVMEDFGVNLAGGVLAGTSDNASNMVTAFSNLQLFFIPCVAYLNCLRRPKK
jgi:hypothetical protein